MLEPLTKEEQEAARQRELVRHRSVRVRAMLRQDVIAQATIRCSGADMEAFGKILGLLCCPNAVQIYFDDVE